MRAPIATRPEYRHYADRDRAWTTEHTLLAVMLALVTFFVAYGTWTTFLLMEQSKFNKSLPQTMLCFDGRHEVTHGDRDWVECQDVRYIPPKNFGVL